MILVSAAFTSVPPPLVKQLAQGADSSSRWAGGEEEVVSPSRKEKRSSCVHALSPAPTSSGAPTARTRSRTDDRPYTTLHGQSGELREVPPSYPRAIPDLLAAMACGSPVVADVGSGTGIPSTLFPEENGNRVFGVELNPEMRAAAEEPFGDHPRFTSVAEGRGHDARRR